jgi:hypothetical protein
MAAATIGLPMMRTNLTVIASVLLAASCTTSDDAGTQLSGKAVYRDAATDHAGAPAQPSAPPPQSAQVSIVVKGSGQIPQIDPQCALDPAGQFEAHYLSTLDMTSGNVYAATVASGSGAIQTPSGCAIPDLTVGLITDVVVRGELQINMTNCDTFCSARARADAETECGTSASSAACRASAETQAEAQCTQTCTTKASALRAEVSLSGSLLGNLDAEALRAAALGELTADLTFDHMVDSDGKRL